MVNTSIERCERIAPASTAVRPPRNEHPLRAAATSMSHFLDAPFAITGHLHLSDAMQRGGERPIDSACGTKACLCIGQAGFGQVEFTESAMCVSPFWIKRDRMFQADLRT